MNAPTRFNGFCSGRRRFQPTRPGTLLLTCLLLALPLLALPLLALPRVVYAHGGGFPRLTGNEAGPYRLYAWSQPNPWRVGEELHLSIGVTVSDAQVETATGPAAEALVSDANVSVLFIPPFGQDALPITRTAVVDQFLGGNYYETDVELSTIGDWRVKLTASGAAGSGSAEFVVSLLPKRQINWLLVGGGAVVMLILLVIAAVVGRMQHS